MTLGQKQRLFSRLLPQLLDYIHGQGYDVAMGEGYVGLSGREAPVHRHDGGHYKKIAQDLDLFKLGVYLRTTEAHAPFGAYWETLHPLCRWGGHWGDGNHYSLSDAGVSLRAEPEED